MAGSSNEARYMPALAALLLITLGVTAWWLYSMTFGPAGRPAAMESLVNSQAASLQTRMAIEGDEASLDALERTSELLGDIKTAGLTDAQRADLGRVRSSVTTIVESIGDIRALNEAVARLDELTPRFTDAVYKLQGELSIQRQPVIIAHLERLRLLGDSLATLSKNMITGDSDLNRRLLDNEMELQQIVRGIRAGDRQLGIVAVTGPETEEAVASLSRRAGQLGGVVKDSLSLSDRLAPVRDASTMLDELVLAMEADRAVFGDPTLRPGIDAELMRLFALLGAAAFVGLVMLAVWLKNSRQRRKTDILAHQTESDQQAILQLLDELGSLADGDLTVQATVGDDITGAIADSINFAIEALRDLVVTINEGAILVGDATKQTETSAHALEAASEAQSRQVKHASEVVQQMAASIDEVSGNAERSSDVARHSVDIAHKGGDAVRRTIEGMNTIRETIQDTSKRIKRLGESSQEIGDIVELINDIADQTNILALNASIQASMAGEAGRGFAVVADEVQRLAERSANATKQIEVLVSTIQSDTNEAVVSMERSTTDVVGGALLAENAGAALEEIEQVSNQIAMLVQNIFGSAREQAGSAKTVLESVQKLREISGETDASAATTRNFISKLSPLASDLRESVSGFILPGGEGSKAQDETGEAELGDGSDDGPQDNEPDDNDAKKDSSGVFADQSMA
ncbi:MAG: chemotaxis protein [Chromatiales bacterium]|nr:chemotaxis protein [Chromatiales bacterium]